MFATFLKYFLKKFIKWERKGNFKLDLVVLCLWIIDCNVFLYTFWVLNCILFELLIVCSGSCLYTMNVSSTYWFAMWLFLCWILYCLFFYTIFSGAMWPFVDNLCFWWFMFLCIGDIHLCVYSSNYLELMGAVILHENCCWAHNRG